jgi:hypothetical protein
LENIAHYRTERELLAEFEPQLPGIFGALLDMMVRGIEMLPTTRVANPPRMADFTHWAVACGVEGFETAYAANRQTPAPGNRTLTASTPGRSTRHGITKGGAPGPRVCQHRSSSSAMAA